VALYRVNFEYGDRDDTYFFTETFTVDFPTPESAEDFKASVRERVEAGGDVSFWFDVVPLSRWSVISPDIALNAFHGSFTTLETISGTKEATDAV
jgi:hypothetical protein